MNTEDYLAIYDQHMRREVTYPRVWREVTPYVVRHIGLAAPESYILYTDLTAENADAVISAEQATIGALGHGLEWKLFGHDQPPDLMERLRRHGFTIDEREALLLLDVENAPPRLLTPLTQDVRMLTTAAQLEDVRQVETAVWEREFDELIANLLRDVQERPDIVTVYAAYAAGVAVAVAWLYFHPGTPFASMWGGSTLAAYRGQDSIPRWWRRVCKRRNSAAYATSPLMPAR